MKFIKKIVFIGLFLTSSMQHLFSIPAFQSMSKEMTQGLLNAIQYTPFPQDSHFKQLLHSTLSHLQNTDRISDIDATINIIISTLGQRKQDSEEIGLLFTVIIVSHVLRIAAQRLYFITAYIRKNLHYWQQIDQQSVVSYCLTHFPTLWGKKIGNNLDIKQKILTAEKLHTVFITHLGNIFRLIHTMPTKIDQYLSKQWVDASFAAISDLCGDKSITNKLQSHTSQNTALHSLRAIKEMLTIFEKYSKNNVLEVKKAISQPAFVKRDFGKIVATIGTIAGIGVFAYYKATSIRSWYEHSFNFAQENIWDPVANFATNIFVPQETSGGLLDKENVEKMLNDFEETKKDLNQQITLVELSEEAKKKVKHSLTVLITGDEKKIPTEDIINNVATIVDQKDIQGALKIIRDRALQEKTIWGSVSDYIAHFDIVISLFVAQLLPTVYKLDQDIVGILSETLKAIARFDREFSTTRKLALLAPAALSIFALYKGGATIYNYITKKDYHILQKSLKELETTTICSIDQPDNNENYGLFIFILESLKQGVVQTVSSRYTDKQDLFRDLARLESPELTFEQRYKLIAQIKQEYSIFQKQ
jgi:hypothetical protein